MSPTPKDGSGSISLLGVRLENVPRAVLVVVSAGLVIGVLFFGWWTQVRQPEYEATLAKQARDLLQASVDEYGKHIAETPVSSAVLIDNPNERLITARYSDGCLFLARTRNGRTRTKLILDIDFEPVPKTGTAFNLTPLLIAPLVAQGRCLNPHPPDSPQYPFTTWYGERRGCWIEVWRRWRDGCTHSQWWDSCHNIWSSNPDGSPAVRWTSCVH